MARRPLTPEQAFPVTPAAPHIRGFWTVDRLTLALIAALLPSLGVAVSGAGFSLVPVLAVALAVAAAWQFAFWRARGLRLTASGAAAALSVAVLLPPDVPLWQAALAMSFGVVIGEQIFGGYGRNFVTPATLTLAFLMFSFPDGGFGADRAVGWAAPLAGGVLLVAIGMVSWRVVIAGLIGALAVLLATAGAASLDPLLSGSLLFCLIFLAGDPVAAPSTNGGRWLYGLGIGALAALGGLGGSGGLRAIVFACLIGSIFAPLIDQGAIWINARRRRRRHDRA